MDGYSKQRVCVVGAGIAGLATAKVLKDDGFDVTVFDRQSAPGGVWAAGRTYPGLRANNSCDSYAFSDFPYPRDADDYPTAEQVRAYLEAYADHFGLRPLFQLSTEVVSVSRSAGSTGQGTGFEVAVRPTGSTAPPGVERFDCVAVCNGVFSEPNIPEVPGRDRFAGEVLHSSRFTDSSAVAGRNVLVVGAGKSALDCAAWAAQHARSCTLVFRAPHWMVPRYFPGSLRTDKLLISRFSELLLPPYHRPSRPADVLHRRASPLVRLWWRGQNRLMTRLLKMPPTFLPEAPLPAGFENIGVGNDFYEAVQAGRLAARRGRIASFVDAGSVELDSGEQLAADVVIFATGWRQGVPFLDQELQEIVFRNGAFRLYRHILPPQEPRLGFIGYASSIACQLTSEIAAHWLSQCFRGELTLPSVDEMEEEVTRVSQWISRTFPGRPEGYFVGPYLAHYVDELLSDMGLPTTRSSNVLTEYMAPLWPARYRGVGEERRRARATTAQVMSTPGAEPAGPSIIV